MLSKINKRNRIKPSNFIDKKRPELTFDIELCNNFIRKKNNQDIFTKTKYKNQGVNY